MREPNGEAIGAEHDESSMGIGEVLELGHQASMLLNSPFYRVANKIAVDQCVIDWVNTAPNDQVKRENLWHEVQAHGRINAIMINAIERAKEIMSQSKDKDLNQSLDDQGFGLDDGYPIQ